MTEKQLIKSLKWAIDKGYGPLIAFKMGYKATTTINHWVTRGSIPNWNHKNLTDIIKDIKEGKAA